MGLSAAKHRVILLFLAVGGMALSACSLCSCHRDDTATAPSVPVAGEPELLAVYQTNVREPSGLAYFPSDSTLYTVSDGTGGSIYQLSLRGEILRELPVNGNDMEGIAFWPDYSSLIVVEEGVRDVVKYTLSGVRIASFHVNVSGAQNKGLEGVAVDTETAHIFVVNQEDPRLLIELLPDGTEVHRTELDVVGSLSDICYDPERHVLWLVSAASRMLCELRTDGTPLKLWRLPIVKPEGVALGPSNRVYVVCDQEAKLYVFAKPD